MTYLSYLILHASYLHEIRGDFEYIFIFKDRIATCGVDDVEVLEDAKVIQYCSGLKEGQCVKLKNPWNLDNMLEASRRIRMEVVPYALETLLPSPGSIFRWRWQNVPVVMNPMVHMCLNVQG